MAIRSAVIPKSDPAILSPDNTKAVDTLSASVNAPTKLAVTIAAAKLWCVVSVKVIAPAVNFSVPITVDFNIFIAFYGSFVLIVDVNVILSAGARG